MINTKSLSLAAMVAFSLGVGTAMAQDSAFFTEQAQQWAQGPVASAPALPNANPAPQYGSSDGANAISSWSALQGGDGAGG
jgi:hypothetical protein